MTREEARKAAEVMLAYANGEEIEYTVKGCNNWMKVDSPSFNWDWEYRIKPKPKFDPKTLQPFDKVITKFSGCPWKCDIFSYYIWKERTKALIAIAHRKIMSMISVFFTTRTPSIL